MISQYFIGGMMPESASLVQQSVNDYRNPAVFGILILSRGGSEVQAPLSRKRKSISRTVSDLTGIIQSAVVEEQPGVEHLRRKARSPLVPPITSTWRPEITFLQTVREFQDRPLSRRRKAASLSSAFSRTGCEKKSTAPIVANCVAVCKNTAGARLKSESVARRG
jgi:hypothetical protein